MKKIELIGDNTLEEIVNILVAGMSDHCDTWAFSRRTLSVEFPAILSKPDSFQTLIEEYVGAYGKEYLGVDLIIFVTKKPLKNGFFYDEMFEQSKRVTIISLADWHEFTGLPIENGILHFFNMTIAEIIDPTFRHFDNSGCVYDFLVDKMGVDHAMKAGTICKTCKKRIFQKAKSHEKIIALKNLQLLQTDLASASKENSSILDYWRKSKKNRIKITPNRKNELSFRDKILENELVRIQELIEDLDLEKTYALLTEFAENNCSEYLQEINLLKIRWNKLLKDERLGILAYDSINMHRNAILFNTLNLLSEIRNSIS